MKNLAIQTDFGTGSMSVAAMHGVAYMVDNDLNVDDINNDVDPFNVLDASDSLLYQFPYWPKGTVFVSVVDPGVGTKRKACVAKLFNGHYVVTPDNGTLTYLKERNMIKTVRQIDETVNRLKGSEDIHIFHGRDVFAYCGARLASGVIDYEGVGPEYPVEEIVVVDYIHPEINGSEVSGMITEASHHFGLVGTNIPFSWMEDAGMKYGDEVTVIVENNGKKILEKVIKIAPTFGDVALNEPLILSSETRMFMLGINQGNAVKEYGIWFGSTWKMIIKK